MSEDHQHKNFLKLFLTHRDSLMAFVRVMVRNREVAEDIFQEVSIVLWEKFGTFREGSSFMAWARQIAVNKIRNERRWQAKAPIAMDDVAIQKVIDAFESLDTGATDQEWREKLIQCMDRLSPVNRNLVKMHYFESIDLGAIAGQLGRSYAGVNSALCKVREQLGECMRKTVERGTADA